MKTHYFIGKTGIYLKLGLPSSGRKGKTLVYYPY
ncbi:hypothetical protein SAMN05444355_112102 [Flavobacterium frigoris]|uniref:Uncharacterized protein n=1 Tax=Flavobacterium frigoris TaxID=229204 RepID=A0A1H9P940_FLAFI|nr:hypothetical protein SAMN05444355_112102 [Flavobacterium frigoris]